MAAGDFEISLLPWQQTVWNDPSRFKIVAAGRRTGKSRLAAYLLLVNALQTGKGVVFYVAPTQGQARDIMWNTIQEVGGPLIAKAHINNLEITLINGARIALKGGDRPETMRGVSLKYLVLDEYADIRPDVWEQILRPALADQKGHALFIGTPMGRNHFFDLFKYAQISGDPEFAAWHFTSFDNPLLDPNEIEAAKKSMSSHAFRQEFMAAFESRGSQMFNENWVRFHDKEDHPTDGDYYITIDPAGFDNGEVRRKRRRVDETAICATLVNENGWWVDKIIHGRWSLDETAQKIFNAVRKYRPVAVGMERGIAKQAILSPLQDMMRRNNFFFQLQELTHGNQKKVDRVMWALQGRFEHGLISLRRDDWNSPFLDQLFQFPDVMTHDDLVDALAYTDQIAKLAYPGNLDDYQDYDILDTVSGY